MLKFHALPSGTQPLFGPVYPHGVYPLFIVLLEAEYHTVSVPKCLYQLCPIQLLFSIATNILCPAGPLDWVFFCPPVPEAVYNIPILRLNINSTLFSLLAQASYGGWLAAA